MKTYKFSLIATFLLISASAFSNVTININNHELKNEYQDSRCFREIWNRLTIERTSGSKCQVSRPLKLVRDQMYRSQISTSPLNIGYWQGQYDKGEKLVETYKHTLINLCGDGVSYSELVQRETSIVYNLENPNLDETITESFRLAPMTDMEAMIAMDNLRLKCEAGDN